ncbi:MAG: HEAT repeat domain-containing protein [Deltaproteobacteria bacterium]|nr:HEAT repeat domain-containing protein [Deltaproteobacteria bacterium]MDL1960998.1 HEAT repeat domain-containing protein [Deltaproteobacteria bacterium]
MNKGNVIDFKPTERLLEKAGSYIKSTELFLEERDEAVPLLLKALKHADHKLKHKIMFLLGSFAKQEMAWPLYRIMTDPDESEEIRHFASIQLSVISTFLKEPQPLTDQLLEDIKSPDPELRINAAFALGWEGNAEAAIPLIELLYDSDIDVQATAVNALSNLRDDRILSLMLERLEHGPLEQKRSILFNLWRFYSRREEVVSVYLRYLDHENADLRFDALIVLATMTETIEHIATYRKCLKDKDARIRALALKELNEVNTKDLLELRDEFRDMLSDPDMEVKKAAMKILKKL